MTDRLKRCWERVFAERQVLIRGTQRVRQIRIPGWVPAAGVVATAAGAVAAVYATASIIEGSRVLSSLAGEVAIREAEVQHVATSNADLRQHVAQLEQQLERATRELNDAQSRLAEAAEQNSELRGQLYTAEIKLKALEEERDGAQQRLGAAEQAFETKVSEFDELASAIETAARHGDTQRTVLAGRLKLLQSEKEAAARRVAEMKAALEAAERKAQLAVAERDRMKVQVAKLDSGPAAPAVRPVGANAPAEEPSGLGGWREIEKLLASAGIDVPGLMAKFNAAPPALGGPFYAIDPRTRGADQVPMENLQRMLKTLPFDAPLETFKVESPFGHRRDPFNGKRAMHSGLDFVAPFRTPVFNTAPGTVVYAGGKGDYGRVVEIDHGHGIMTRYAHLHRTSVVKGQRLTSRVQVGQLGSSGRSSGPHLHYEILVNGVPQDPQRFLEAGRNAVKAISATK